MTSHLRANLWLLVLSVLLCSVVYPLVLLGIGHVAFYDKAQGSLMYDARGKEIGSRLIAQPFTDDKYFQPRPSSASYNAAASGASNWAASNYLLRDRVACQLGPIVKYHSGPQKGKLAGPDIEAWFQQDRFNDKPGIVAQWAKDHSSVAQNWIKADKLNSDYVAQWQKSHPDQVAQWVKDNPDTPEPKPEDLGVPFFTSYAQQYPGTFPTIVEKENADKKKEKVIERVKTGNDIQAHFFDMWLAAHPEADLERVPGDMLTTSGSGLDPHITLDNALWQLDRVVTARAGTSGKEADIRGKINHLLLEKQIKPLGGMVGVPLINVLEINVEVEKLLGG